MVEHRPEPQGTAQAVGRVVEEVVGGLRSSPVLLALMMLNVIGIGAACWFLSRLATAQSSRVDLILKACLPRITP